MSRFLLLVVFIIVLQAVGAGLGFLFSPGTWYAGLEKPFFNPPGYVFGTVWPILYLLVAIAGWRVFITAGEKPGWGLWVTQMVLNWAWTPIFFGAQMIFWAIWIIAGALAVSLTFVSTTWPRDRLAALCFIPYCAWLAFALLLNVSIWWLN